MTMPSVRGAIPFAGRTLVFDFNALCALEDAFDLTIEEVFQQLGTSPRMTTIRTFVRIGLSSAGEVAGDEVAGALIDEAGGLAAAMAAILAGMKASVGEAETGARPPKAAGGTGSPSSPRGARKGSTPTASGNRPR